MGSEDLFHKRKARRKKDSERRESSRQPYDRVLIVCEGEKTEPFYFEEVKVVLGLDSANVEIDGTSGSSPISVVRHAESLFNTEQQTGGLYNRVFCVFDRDSHTSYHQAIKTIDTINSKLIKAEIADQPVFTAIRSEPAFEYWLLLHYFPSTKSYQRTQRKSIGDQVIDDLKQFLPDYKKTQKGIFKMSCNNELLESAKAHSLRIYKAAQKNGNMNPSTNMHEIIDYLQKLKGG